MEKLLIIDAFQKAHDEYFRLLMVHYPLAPNGGGDFGPPELCELAIEAQSCATALGPVARERLTYLGLDLLYSFDNPVDQFNWRAQVRRDSISHTTFTSIAIRIDSELKRVRRILQLGGAVFYDAMPPDIFLVSKNRYETIKTSDLQKSATNTSKPKKEASVHIQTVNIQYAADDKAVNRLQEVEKKTTIGSNISNIINTLRAVFG